jgi:hypothetical protein
MMHKLMTMAVLVLALPGCAVLPNIWGKSTEPVVIKKEEVARTPLNLPDPGALKTTPVTWIVVTPENINRVWEELRNKKADLVLFALTDDGYEQLSIDFAQIRNFIEQQRQVIVEYRRYYEPAKPDPKESKK